MEAARRKEETETGCEGGEVTRPNVKKARKSADELAKRRSQYPPNRAHTPPNTASAYIDLWENFAGAGRARSRCPFRRRDSAPMSPNRQSAPWIVRVISPISDNLILIRVTSCTPVHSRPHFSATSLAPTTFAWVAWCHTNELLLLVWLL